MDKVTETREQRLAGIRERTKALAKDLADMIYCGAGDEWKHAVDIDRLVAFADSERERVLLEAAKAVCEGCGKDAIVLRVDGGFFHLANGQYVGCEAAAIHNLRSKRESR